MGAQPPSARILGSLWSSPVEPALAELLPRTWEEVAALRQRLAAHLDRAPRRLEGRVDPAAIVRGEIVAMGPGSVIEAGAVVHESCRLVLGANSRLRSTSLVRDEVVIGRDCSIGAYCEVARSLMLDRTALGHWVFVGDSVLGADNMLAGAVFIANSSLHAGRTIRIAVHGAKLDTGVDHLGMLSGDGVRFGASVLVTPGAIVMPGLTLPPGVVLHGVVDRPRASALMERFQQQWCRDPGETPDTT
jgi:NDP-sugar pyrophosphorylase family protein